jgi:hypothetical protein
MDHLVALFTDREQWDTFTDWMKKRLNGCPELKSRCPECKPECKDENYGVYCLFISLRATQHSASPFCARSLLVSPVKKDECVIRFYTVVVWRKWHTFMVCIDMRAIR